MDEYISTKEAAHILGYTPGYVAVLCRKGEFNLVTKQEGGRKEWKIPKISVEYYKRKKEESTR